MEKPKEEVDSLIVLAASRTSTDISEWRMIGQAAVHVDVTPSDNCCFCGPAIVRCGNFHGGYFRGGNFHGGYFHGGNFRGGDFRGGNFRGGNWNRSPVFIQGTRYGVCESDNEHIASGCIRKPVAWWLENVERCAEEHGYPPEQQAEYREIFEFVAARMRALGEIKTTSIKDT